MMQQYLSMKDEHRDQILMFRLGDFYEMFFDDAVTASRELELTLTGRDCGLPDRAPMCGVPYHSVENYIARLVKKGYKVAICEQMENPALAKGMVKRDIVRVVTPGTLMEANMLEEGSNNYICSLCPAGERCGLAFADISTGSVLVTEVSGEMAAINELGKYAPHEVIYAEELPQLTITQSPAGVPTVASDEAGALSLQEIYRRCIGSVVSIVTVTPSGKASGTGIIMSEDGYVITNHHVIESAQAVSVLTADSQEYTASVVGSDETSDLAVLKIEAEGLQAAEFGDSSVLQVGDSVAAIGDPLGTALRGTMTDGIVSAINRDLTVNDRTMSLIQTNAALNNGNSGGPLINCYGQVIGINTMKMSNFYSSSTTVEGIGFAIPIDTAKPIIDELIEKGYVSGRPAIGIDGETLPATYRIYYRLPQGIYVTRVYRNSDAAAKGISEGDIITAINGVSVTTMEQLNRVKNQFTAGQTITLTIYHGGVSSDVEIILMDRANA